MTKEKTTQQQQIIEKLGLTLSFDQINAIIALGSVEALTAQAISTEELLQVLHGLNGVYRAGFPLVDDQTYDNVYLQALKNSDPEHEFLNSVEPETLLDVKTITLPQKMLSTDKSYSFEAIKKWVDKLIKAADELNIALSDLTIRVTPKLDGYAGYDDGQILYTRGDGVRGQNVTRAFERGLNVAKQGERGEGPGEIVIKKSYFEENLKQHFENSRNIQAAIIAEKKIDKRIQKAVDDGACVFYPFSLLTDWQGNYTELLTEFDNICDQIWNAVDFDVDGIILETTVPAIKQHMGSTRHHHRWQIAYKVNDETAQVKVLSITAQTSRTGKITPVAELEPTKLSGATLSRATAHHYAMVRDKGIGPGALVELVRSGLVIPKIERVIEKVTPQFPEHCSSCHSKVAWEGDNLICLNTTSCPAQIENTMTHFFKTIGNIDGFGPKVIAKLHVGGINQIHQIYNMTRGEFSTFGVGAKNSENLENELARSRAIEIEDWRFLAAFGVTRMGLGNCERLLQHHALAEIFTISTDDMLAIDGFAEITAQAIFDGLQKIKEDFFKVYDLGFNLIKTLKIQDQLVDNAISGKQIVFTGSMQQGARKDMEKQAKALGAKIGKAVTSKTSLLVTGEKVGANKINAAKEKGVAVITEQAYLDLLNG